MGEDRCICCGAVIPEGKLVCPACENNFEKNQRDPGRIDHFCRMLAYYWHRVPDWRFGQLISNVLGAYVDETHKDIFFPEDNELLDFFNKYFKQNGSAWYGKDS